jgi:hypothetical protein
MSNTYHLETIAMGAMSTRREGEPQLAWTESKTVDGGWAFWFSEEDTFQIEKKPEEPKYPFELKVQIMGGKFCRVGPFHSLAAAKEAAERMNARFRESKIHHSQLIGGGFFAVASRVVFPDL